MRVATCSGIEFAEGDCSHGDCPSAEESDPRDMIGISAAEIHLWFANDRIDSETAAACRAVMTEDERQQEQRFHFQRDRDRHVVTRALVRKVLSRYESLHPADWVFSKNAYGRPEIDLASPGISDLFFNISHTDGLIVVAIARGRAVGVDVESIRADRDLLDVAKQVFSPAEFEELFRLPAECQLDRFFQLWTLKESYIKARGMGVSIPLQKFGFRLDQNGTIDLEIAAELADDARRWQCWQFRPADGYLLALCAERSGQVSPAIIARRTASFDPDDTAGLQADRVSLELHRMTRWDQS